MAEIIVCANCQRKLQVPEQFLGQTVQCPDCGQMFVASATTVSAAPVQPPASASQAPRYADDEDDYPNRRRRRFEDEEDEYDDFDPLPRIRHIYAPHRGGVILTLGLVSLIGGWVARLPVIVGPFAWYLGARDLRAIRAGEMDPAGESMTRTGQVCGIISTLILIGCVLVAFFAILAEVGGF